MDQVFLDANILFSAAYRENSPLAGLWAVKGARLITSDWAVDEARRNLKERPQTDRLEKLIESLVVVATPSDLSVLLPDGVELPAKDLPILAAAIHGKVDASPHG